MKPVIDLADVPQRERATAWAQAIRGEYLDVDIRFPGLVYPSGQIARAWAGAVSLSSFAGSSQVHERTNAMADADDVDWLVGAFQLSGHSHIAHLGRETDLKPGELVIFDATEKCQIDFRDEHRVIFLTVPRVFFLDNANLMRHLLNIRVDERCGSTLIIDYFKHIMTQGNDLTLAQRTSMSALGIRLLVDAAAASAGAAPCCVMNDRMLVLD